MLLFCSHDMLKNYAMQYIYLLYHFIIVNNYILATMIATYTNRVMVILEPPSQLNNIKGNSQFGCPKEAWTYLHLLILVYAWYQFMIMCKLQS